VIVFRLNKSGKLVEVDYELEALPGEYVLIEDSTGIRLERWDGEKEYIGVATRTRPNG